MCFGASAPAAPFGCRYAIVRGGPIARPLLGYAKLILKLFDQSENIAKYAYYLSQKVPLLHSPSHFPSLSPSSLVSSANCLSSLMPKQATATRTLPTPIKQLSRLLRPNVKKNTPFHTLLLSHSLSLSRCCPCYVQEKQLPNFSCFFTAKE